MSKKKSDPEGLEVIHEFHPEKLQKAHEEGDPLALYLCVLYCDHKRRRLPAWVRTELAQRVGEASDKIIIKAMLRKAPASLAIAAVMAAEVFKFESDDRFFIAERLLEDCGASSFQGKPFEQGNIKKIWGRRLKDNEPLVNDTALYTFASRLFLAECLVSKEEIPGKIHRDKIIYALAKLSSD